MSTNDGCFFALPPETRFDRVAQSLKSRLGITSDANLARALGIETKAYAARKRNASIPYEEVLMLCERDGIPLNEVFELEPLLQDAGRRSKSAESAHLTLWRDIANTVSEELSEQQLQLPAGTFLEFVDVLFEHFKTTEQIDRNLVKRHLKLVS